MDMTADLTLFDIEHPTYAPRASIDERFAAFHEANPAVLTALETLASQYLAAGHKRIGVGMLVEVLRWTYDLRTTGDPFRINHDYRSRYVRLLIARHPEWADVFETRTLRAA